MLIMLYKAGHVENNRFLKGAGHVSFYLEQEGMASGLGKGLIILIKVQ